MFMQVKYIRAITLVTVIAILAVTPLKFCSAKPYRDYVLVFVDNVEAYITVASFSVASNYKIIPVMSENGLPENARILDLRNTSSFEIAVKLLRENENMISFSGVIVMAGMEKIDPLILYQLYLKNMLVVIHPDIDYAKSYFINSGLEVFDTRGIVEYQPYQDRRIVICFKGDDTAYLAAFYSIAKNASLLYVESPEKIRVSGDNLSITYVISFELLREYGITGLYKPLIVSSNQSYFTENIGILTAFSLKSLSTLIARNIYYFYSKLSPHNALLANLAESTIITERIAHILEQAGIETTLLISTDRYDNLTRDTFLREISNHDILFLNLHGNPYGMAKTTTGPYLITARTVPKLKPGTIVVTLSCETCNIEEIYSPKDSIAMSFVSNGAICYIGARRVEYVGELGTSTGYPEAIIALLLSGYTVGEAVRFINNIHIKEIGGKEPWVTAYTCLIGDPDIKLSNTKDKIADFKLVNDKLIIKTLEKTSVIVGKIKVPFTRDEIKGFEIKDSTVRKVFVILREEGKNYLYFMLTRFPSYNEGLFDKGEVIDIRVIYKIKLENTLPLLLLVIVVFLFLALFIKKRALKINR